MEVENGQLIMMVISGCIVALFAMLFVVSRRYQRDRLETWERFAIERGLFFHPPAKRGESPRIEGRLGDRAFALYEATIPSDGPDSNTRSVTRMDLAPRGMPEGLTAHARATGRIGKAIETLAFNVTERLGARVPDEVATGNPTIDQEWVIRGFDADEVRAWISSEVRLTALLEVYAEKELSVVDDAIRWQGTLPNERDEIAAISCRLEVYADRFEGS